MPTALKSDLNCLKIRCDLIARIALANMHYPLIACKPRQSGAYGYHQKRKVEQEHAWAVFVGFELKHIINKKNYKIEKKKLKPPRIINKRSSCLCTVIILNKCRYTNHYTKKEQYRNRHLH